MALTPAQKLKIKAGSSIRLIDAPEDFLSDLEPLPADLHVVNSRNADQIHWFVKDRQQLEAGLEKVTAMVKGNVICWVYYPKGSSKMQTDLTRDKGWDKLLSYTEFQWISLISFNETWSAFGFRLKSVADLKKEAHPTTREIFNYVNPETKEVTMPVDLRAALLGKPEMETFSKLAFTHKKDYIEWIITAKREATRKQRIESTLERLSAGWKNPRNI